MVLVYPPDPGAEPVPPWSTALLSQRDLSLRIPLNYVTYPGVSVTKACFGKNVFDDASAMRCWSNLFATGFRRFILDLYWDDTRRVWAFCPVQLSSNASSILSITASTAQLTARSGPAHSGSLTVLDERQVDSSLVVPSATRAATSTNTPAPASVDALFHVGPYSCSQSLDLSSFTTVLADYMANTGNNLQAIVTYLTLNLHVAAPSPSTDAPQLSSSNVPAYGQLVGNLLNVNLSNYLYTPRLLRQDRANLNSSWYTATDDHLPQDAYFNTTTVGNGDFSTSNGWPSESILEFSKKTYRLAAEYGQIDPQLSLYNFTGDAGLIFSEFAFQASPGSQLTSNDDQSCFFNYYDDTIAAHNNSWAVSSQLNISRSEDVFNDGSGITSSYNLTACGISPLLNETLFNKTANEDYRLYQTIAYSSIWSWAAGEPRNISSSDDKSMHIRCAAFDAEASGRWHVADCKQKHYAACRVGNEPYVWRISSNKAAYSPSDETCPSGSSFDVPRTALENQHLLSAVQQRRGEDRSDTIVWLNFNSLDISGCWVNGISTRCPYQNGVDTKRKLIVPIVAAVIVFVVTGLTLFVKCAANRQKSRTGRRRKRANDGWDYEGVPS
ncbi:hypothetical protein EJ08DRAFT_679552 [Tothia fuscella]|uniref:Maintenance of telomere capping protein 6 n=1 Tax=Tothia fuscella TaxID=1048955 RepID=A0A9P4NRQ7_9PEZI|nr:hypothetical protein EJ08DRAFT_679552 [Tothia fuscella]